MKTYEATGKNYEEALQNGLNALHATISDVTVETLEEGSKGLFGLFGSKPCKLRLTLHEVEEEVEEVKKTIDKKYPGWYYYDIFKFENQEVTKNV